MWFSSYFSFFLVPACQTIGADNIECVKRGDNNCFEDLHPTISSSLGCEGACMFANSHVGPPPHVACVFYVWYEKKKKVHFLNWAKKSVCAAHGCCRHYDIFQGELTISSWIRNSLEVLGRFLYIALQKYRPKISTSHSWFFIIWMRLFSRRLPGN